MFTNNSDADAASVREIEAVVDDYFKGYLRAEPETLLKAFDERARLMSVDANELEIVETARWVEGLRLRRAKGDVRAADACVLGIDVAGDAAVAKTTLIFPAFAFTDYLSLLRCGSGWKIVHKIYTVARAPAPAS
jgi:hypothetical protein